MHAENTGEPHKRSMHTNCVTWQLNDKNGASDNKPTHNSSNAESSKYQIKKYQNNFAGFSQENPNIYLFWVRKLTVTSIISSQIVLLVYTPTYLYCLWDNIISRTLYIVSWTF